MILFAEYSSSMFLGTPLQIELPEGLVGLRHLRNLEITAAMDDGPLLNFQALDDTSWTFLGLEPAGVIPHYALELSDHDADALELYRAEDAAIFNIVTAEARNAGRATTNLVGPLIVNRYTGIGRQVIIANSAQYSTRYLLPREALAGAHVRVR
jgi:flagellar assembly factor FliW